MYEKGLKYMFGLSAFFMIFQITLAYQLIYKRKHTQKNMFQKIQKYNRKSKTDVVG